MFLLEQDARAKMVTEQRAVRTKVVSADGYYLDTMFFDRRRYVGLSLLHSIGLI